VQKYGGSTVPVLVGDSLAEPLLRNLVEIGSLQGSVGWVEE
jgi:hypothetical protein